MTPLVAFSIAGQRSAGTRPRATQLVTTWGVTPISLARADGLPRMEIAELSAIPVAYTKSLERSNDLFETAVNDSVHNSRMDLIKRINAILEARKWGWADLARAMELSEQRVNNWRNRGIPAAQVRNIETALGLKRYTLDEGHTEEDETAAVVAEFSLVYRNATEQGRLFLRNTIKVAADTFVTKERRSINTTVSVDRRQK